MAGYIGPIPVPQATQTRETFTATASQTTFNTAGYQPGYLDVFMNGVKLIDGSDYTATNGSDVVLSSGAAVNDLIEVVAYTAFEVLNQNFTGTTTVADLTVTGDLTVDGTTTTINSTTLNVDDINITVASGAADAAAANGAGLTVDGANATFNYASSGDKWTMNKDLDITGTAYSSALQVSNATDAQLILDDTGGTAGGAMNTEVVFNAGGVFGGSVGYGTGGGYMALNNGRGPVVFNTNNSSGSASRVNAILYNTSNVFNENGENLDFRVESDSDTHALFVDASTNRVGISTSAPPVQFTVGGGDGTAELLLWGSNANSTSSRLIFGGQDPYTSEYIQFRYNSDSNLLQLETDTGFGVGKIVQFDRQYGRVTFNEDSALNADVRIESDAHSHAFFCDSNTNVITFFTDALPIMGSASTQGVSIGNGGNAEMRILNTTTSPNMWLKKQGTVGNAIAFYKDTSSVGTIYVNASSVSYNTTSDYRLKENVVDLTGATERVKQLAPKRFNFIADEDDAVVDGFIAHEAQTVVPEAVTGTHNEVDDDGNPVYQGIDQAKLVPLLTAALQEAITKIEDLEARVAALET